MKIFIEGFFLHSLDLKFSFFPDNDPLTDYLGMCANQMSSNNLRDVVEKSSQVSVPHELETTAFSTKEVFSGPFFTSSALTMGHHFI